MMNIAERTQIGWRFWLLWVLASLFGFLLGEAVISRLSVQTPETVTAELANAAVLGMTLAVPIALAQWLVLRGRISGNGWWTPATIVGGALASPIIWVITLVVAVNWSADQLVISVIATPISGALWGTSQWLVLRRQVSRSGWWVLASAVGWEMTLVVPEAISFAADGVLYGAITGAVLVWLLRQTVLEEPGPPKAAA